MAYTITILDTGTTGRTHETLAQAEAALPNITAGDGGFASIQMHDDSVFTDKDVLVSATAEDLWGGYEIRAAPGKEWAGIEGSGVVIRPTGSADYIIRLFQSRVLMHGIELDGSAATSFTTALLALDARPMISRCAIHDSPDSHGVTDHGVCSGFTASFSVFYNNKQAGYFQKDSATAFLLGCGAANNGTFGFRSGSANTTQPTACWAFDNPSGDYTNVFNNRRTGGNIASDTSLPTSVSRLNLNSQAIGDMNFVDAPNGDFHIQAGSVGLQRGPVRHMRPLAMANQFWTLFSTDMDGAILESTMVSTDLLDTGPHQFSYPPVVVATVPTPTPNATVVDPQTDMDLTGTIDNAGSYLAGDILTVHLDSDGSEVGVGDAAAGTWRASGLTNGALQTLKFKGHRSGATSSVFSSTVTGTPTGTPTVGVGRVIAVVSPETIVGVVTEG